VDFLKMDCEGAEWFIEPEELKGIRRIEAEVHLDRKKRKTADDFVCNKLCDYQVLAEKRRDASPKVMLVHAKVSGGA